MYKMYTLTHIIDANSSYKSEIAKSVVRQVIQDRIPNVKYIPYEDDREFCNRNNCENNICPPKKRKICNVAIKDKFVLRGDPGQLVAGNHCIATFIEENLISNLPKDAFDFIIEQMNVRNVCTACKKSCKQTQLMHTSCLKRKEKLHADIKLRAKVKIFSKILTNNDTIVKIQRKNTFSYRDVNFINDLIQKYPELYENAHRLNKLENNCIVSSVQMRRRLPTDKQLGILKLILENYEFIYDLDQRNINPKYQRYGFIYRSSQRSPSVPPRDLVNKIILT